MGINGVWFGGGVVVFKFWMCVSFMVISLVFFRGYREFRGTFVGMFVC